MGAKAIKLGTQIIKKNIKQYSKKTKKTKKRDQVDFDPFNLLAPETRLLKFSQKGTTGCLTFYAACTFAALVFNTLKEKQLLLFFFPYENV